MAQTPYRQYANDGVEMNFFEIENVDFRAYLLYNLTQDDRFELIAEDENGILSLSSSNDLPREDFFDTFEDFYNNAYADFQMLSKIEITDMVAIWKSQVDPRLFTSIMMDIILRWSKSDNEHCIDAAPLCTSNFHVEANMTGQTADEENMDDGCISGQSYSPSWYYLKIQDPGSFAIFMAGRDPDTNVERDIDFCMWGPYNEEQVFSGYSCTHLTSDKIIDCCFSMSYSETIFLGYPDSEHVHSGSGHGTINYHVPQTGEYYVLMITNYSRQPTRILLDKEEGSGPGTTDCALLSPPIVNNNGPYCVGETIQLTAIGEFGSYSWTGPNGYRSRYQNPNISNCTMDMGGYYVCTILASGLTGQDSTLVEVYPNAVASFTASATTVCVGNPVQFTSTSTTNPTGYTISTSNWNFGDGQTASGTTASHTFNESGIYMVTLSVAGEDGHCTDEVTQTITVSEGEDIQHDPVISCHGYTMIWADGSTQTFYESGTYEVTHESQTEGGCPRIEYITITITDVETEEISVTECDTYTWTNGDGQTYTSSGDHVWDTQTPEGCPKTVTLHLTINHSEEEDFNVTECDSYRWHGTNYTQSGDYVYNTTTAQGCPRTETLHLTINHSETEDFNVTECDSYRWHGTNYTQSGNYVYNTTTAQGCPRTETLHLTINYSENEEFNEAACESYIWHGQTYTSSGNYTYETTTAQGCQRTETLHLTISDVIHKEWYAQFCTPFLWNEETYIETGDYEQTFESVQGCDSIVTLHLTIDEAMHSDTVALACNAFEWYDGVHTESGDYEYVFTSAQGCDSIVTLRLTIDEVKHVDFSEQACESFTWDGTTYDATGDYVQTFQTQGCDSIVTLYLTIYDAIHQEWSAQSCVPYSWNGENYSVSGDYVQTFESVQGCDSIVTLHLTISDAIHQEWSAQSCVPYAWNGEIYTESGDYVQTFESTQGCDSIVTLHLTIGESLHSETTVVACDAYEWYDGNHLQSGDYDYTFASQQGCDSIVTLHLTINPSETEEYTITAAYSYTWHGETYTESDTYTFDTLTAQGCPRTETLYLTITQGQQFYTIIATAGPYGHISPEGEIHVVPGGMQTFTLTPDEGSALSRVIIDGVEYEPTETVAFTNVRGNHTIHALFWGMGVDDLVSPTLNIYPNPAKDRINVESPNMKRIAVFSLLGVQVGSMDVNDDYAVIGTKEFPQGTYIMKVEYNDGSVGRSQFVVMR